MAPGRQTLRGRTGQKSVKWDRANRILALVPPERASSTDTSGTEDEVIVQNFTRRRYSSDEDTKFSSEPRSLPSSFENLHLLSSDEEELEGQDTALSVYTVPLTPVMNEMFPADIQQAPLPILNSISSVLSPLQTPPSQTTRSSKRKANTGPRFLAKKAKKYIKPALQFKWKPTKFKYPAVLEETVFSLSDIDEFISPIDYFFRFFSEDIIEYITEHTNLYSVQGKSGKSINITSDDMRDFLAITIKMGIIKMPSYRDYWSRELRCPIIADIMSLKKYEQIRQYLHFADNLDTNDDRYFKVRPLLEKIRKNCLLLEEEDRYSVDEMMVPYKGTRAGNRRQYLPKKPKKWGFKIFVRAGVSGLVYDFLPYGGDDTFRNIRFSEYEESLGLGAKVVLALSKTIVKRPAVVYFDNFFTTLELVHYLREEYGIFSLGTINANRLKDCKDILPTDKALSKKGRGSSKQVVCNEKKVTVVKWLDNKAVTLASSFVDSHPMEKIKRWSKDAKSRIDIDCPQIVKQYNAHMGGVDLADMLVALYRTHFKTKRWYMALFIQMLDICVNNAWLLYRRHNAANKNIIPLKTFRVQIAEELLKKHRVRDLSTSNDVPNENKIRRPFAPRPAEAVRYDSTGHFPDFITRGRCKYCKTGLTNVHCVKCDQRLCFVSTKKKLF